MLFCTPQLPFPDTEILPNRRHEALHRGALGGVGVQAHDGLYIYIYAYVYVYICIYIGARTFSGIDIRLNRYQYHVGVYLRFMIL